MFTLIILHTQRYESNDADESQHSVRPSTAHWNSSHNEKWIVNEWPCFCAIWLVIIFIIAIQFEHNFFFLRYNAKKQLCIMGNEYYDCCFCFRQSFGSVYLFVCVCLAHWQANKLAHLLQTMAKTREKNMNRRPPNIILHTYTESESQRGNGWEKWIEIPSII